MTQPSNLIPTCLIMLVLAYPDAITAAERDYELTPVNDKIMVIYGPLELPDRHNRGFRNNAVIVKTSEGPVVFDPGGSAYAGEMIARTIKRAFDAPVIAVFNSHVHGDHWLGNEGIRRLFPTASIYAHPRMKRRLESGDGERWLTTINRVTEHTADGKLVVGPDHVVSDGDIITVGDTRFRILHYGASHTDNDIMIEVVGEDILFTGDVVRNGLLGIMEADASFKGNINAIDSLLATPYARYIPGHGDIGDASMVRRYRNYLHTLRTRVEALYAEGLSDYEMKPQVLEAVDDYRHWEGFDLRVGPHISRAFLEVEQEAFQ
ncbi:MAG: MBL fold metallo-hydrolase [Candidatus Thiodiazotropha sp.]